MGNPCIISVSPDEMVEALKLHALGDHSPETLIGHLCESSKIKRDHVVAITMRLDLLMRLCSDGGGGDLARQDEVHTSLLRAAATAPIDTRSEEWTFGVELMQLARAN